MVVVGIGDEEFKLVDSILEVAELAAEIIGVGWLKGCWLWIR